MENEKYDVFISYSRKDYVQDDEVIPGNPISAIQKLFDENGISYWIDKNGISSGEAFATEISKAIINSKMLVFVSSRNSNVSNYTCGEILKAKKEEKLIIPFLIDECDYNEKFEILLLPLNHINYVAQPNTAFPELLRAVKREKEKVEKKESDAERERERQISLAKKEIKEKTKDFQALAGQQNYILKELYAKNRQIGNTVKRCPVCENVVPIQSMFCDRCSWQFPELYYIDGNETPIRDEVQLTLARTNWQKLGSTIQLQNDNNRLNAEIAKIEDKCKKLEASLSEAVRKYNNLLGNDTEVNVNVTNEQPTEKEFHELTFSVDGILFKMISVIGGTFMMGTSMEQGSDGTNNDNPAHPVTLGDFYIGETVVTQALWKAVMGGNPSHFIGDEHLPVEFVSWNICQLFIKKLNSKTGHNFRLPTEAEWEYAARGGNKSNGFKYAGGDIIDDVALYDGNSDNRTHPVKSKKANELGLYDMSGNVWEWCQDWYSPEYYQKSPTSNPQGPMSGSWRVLRGGGWISLSEHCCVTSRFVCRPDSRESYYGFRLVLDIK